jgi:hypothetical protein
MSDGWLDYFRLRHGSGIAAVWIGCQVSSVILVEAWCGLSTMDLVDGCIPKR